MREGTNAESSSHFSMQSSSSVSVSKRHTVYGDGTVTDAGSVLPPWQQQPMQTQNMQVQLRCM